MVPGGRSLSGYRAKLQRGVLLITGGRSVGCQLVVAPMKTAVTRVGIVQYRFVGFRAVRTRNERLYSPRSPVAAK